MTESGFSDHRRFVQYYHIGYPYVTDPPEGIRISTHRIECAIDWVAPKTIPFKTQFENQWKFGQGPLQYAKKLGREGEFWINSQVQQRMAAMSSDDKTKIMEHMAKDKRILPVLAERQVDPVPFFVRFVAKREWQAQETMREWQA